MPNYVRNRISFSGDPGEIARMLEEIRDPEQGPGSVDFDRIVPMPEALNIEAGSRTDEGLRMYGLFVRTCSEGGDPARFDRYRKEHPDSWELGMKAYANTSVYGCPTWYEWRVNNWGTKWPAMTPDGAEAEPGTLLFETAWSFPKPVLEQLSRMYPSVRIEAEWADEDIGRNCGRAVFEAGRTVELDIPEDGRESVEFAARVWDSAPSDWGLYPSADGTGYEYADAADGGEER